MLPCRVFFLYYAHPLCRHEHAARDEGKKKGGEGMEGEGREIAEHGSSRQRAASSSACNSSAPGRPVTLLESFCFPHCLSTDQIPLFYVCPGSPRVPRSPWIISRPHGRQASTPRTAGGTGADTSDGHTTSAGSIRGEDPRHRPLSSQPRRGRGSEPSEPGISPHQPIATRCAGGMIWR